MKSILKVEKREIIDLLIEFIYLATVFIVPLYFSVVFSTYNVFELNKIIVFEILVLILLFLTIVKLVFYRPERFLNFEKTKDIYSWLKEYIFIPLLFIIGLGLILFFSTDWSQSFFGSYDRQAGYLSNIFYFIWFILLVFNILTIDNRSSQEKTGNGLAKRIKRIIYTITFSGFLVAIYGLLQILGIDFLSWPEDPLLTKRTLSTFGQPNFLASWLLLIIPLSTYLIFKSKTLFVKSFYGLALLAQLACLLATASRGGVFALGLMGILFVFYLIFFTKLKLGQKVGASLGLLGLILLGFWGLNYLLPGRLDGLLDFKSGSLAARANFYQAAADAIVKKPVFGYGLENSGEVFIHYYQADWGIYGDVGSTTDKAHNLVLDIILATGFLGLFLYTILYYYFFRLAQENIKKNKKKSLSLALSFGVLAYLFSLMFSFSIVAGEVYFWLFLALLVVIGTGNKCEEYQVLEFKARRQTNIFTKLIIVLVIGLPIGWGVSYEFKVLIADHYFNCLYYTLAEEKYFTTFVLADYISNQKTSPINQKYYNRFLGDKLSDFYPNITELSSKKASQDKLQEIEKRLSSRGYENLFVKAKINSALGNYQMAEKYFREVIKISPNWPKTYIELARLFVKQGNFKEAILNYRLAEVILPAANDSRLNDLHRQVLNLYQKIIAVELGDIYFNLKDYPAAEKYYQQAYRLDVRDFSLFKRIADTFYLRGDFNKALAYNLRGTTRNPRDYNWFFGVAVLYQEIGDKEKALFFLDKAIELAPTEEKLIKLRLKYQS